MRGTRDARILKQDRLEHVGKNVTINRRHKAGLFLTLTIAGVCLLVELSAKQVVGITLLTLAFTWLVATLRLRTVGLSSLILISLFGLYLAAEPIWKDWRAFAMTAEQYDSAMSQLQQSVSISAGVVCDRSQSVSGSEVPIPEGAIIGEPGATQSQLVRGPDGRMYQFPVGTTKEQAIAYFKKRDIGVEPSADWESVANNDKGHRVTLRGGKWYDVATGAEYDPSREAPSISPGKSDSIDDFEQYRRPEPCCWGDGKRREEVSDAARWWILPGLQNAQSCFEFPGNMPDSDVMRIFKADILMPRPRFSLARTIVSHLWSSLLGVAFFACGVFGCTWMLVQQRRLANG